MDDHLLIERSARWHENEGAAAGWISDYTRFPYIIYLFGAGPIKEKG